MLATHRDSLDLDHLNRCCRIYGELREANPHLADLPANPLWIRWRYLPHTRWRCYGQAQESRFGAILSINPHAFDDGWDVVLTGIINHEMVHLLHPDIGHHDPFKEYEMGWDGYREFRIELERFRSYAEELAYNRTIVHVYKCPSCDRRMRTDRILPRGSSCKHCCKKYNRGKISPHYSLIYEGREGMDNDGNREPSDNDRKEEA